MTDRELLELAAKAACYKYTVRWVGGNDYALTVNGECWNPLIDDGDALRLAVKLRLVITVGAFNVEARRWTGGDMEPTHCQIVAQDDDPLAAARRAIVSAAAEIEKGAK